MYYKQIKGVFFFHSQCIYLILILSLYNMHAFFIFSVFEKKEKILIFVPFRSYFWKCIQ